MLNVDKVSLNVRDQEAAKAFWVEKMGFEVIQDTPVGEAGSPRWIEVRGPRDGVELVLFSTAFDESKIGQLGRLLFTCADIEQAHADLSARGVEFADPPARSSGGGGRPSRTTRATSTAGPAELTRGARRVHLPGRSRGLHSRRASANHWFGTQESRVTSQASGTTRFSARREGPPYVVDRPSRASDPHASATPSGRT